MSVKALQKQLIAAVAMVIVAVIAVSSSTFAWFAQNKTVTAQTMSVTAKSADPFLQIKDLDAPTDFTTALKSTWVSGDEGLKWNNTSATELKLVTPTQITYKDGTVKPMAWGEAVSTDPDDAQGNKAVDAVALSGADILKNGTNEPYVLCKKLQLKNAAATADATNLTVAATISGTATDLNAAARVLIVVENDPTTDTNIGNYVALKADGTAAALTKIGTNHGTDVTTSKVLAATLGATKTIDVTVYVFFDGTDAVAKTTTAVPVTALNVDLTFTVA